MESPLDPRNPPPDGYGSTQRLGESSSYIGSIKPPGLDWVPSNETAEEKEERLKRLEEKKIQRAAEQKWESEDKVRYETLQQQAESALQ